MQTRLLFVHALSPLHAGTGQSIGAVDLAIARDRATEHPYVPGSSIKGSLRARSATLERQDTTRVFGPDTDRASDHAGVLLLGDANLLLLPVRSVSGTFAWATSRLLLAKYARDAREAGVELPSGGVPGVDALGRCAITSSSALKVSSQQGSMVVFEDLDFSPSSDANLDAWAKHLGEQLFPEDDTWQRILRERFCVVHDDVMTFLSRHGTDVVTRVKLDHEKKTVDRGALWTEESLPVETVLVSLAAAQTIKGAASPDEALQALAELTKGAVQLGGKATVGRGRCRVVVTGGAR
jgi:CRISPR-associated protein Cmr4